jgi:hypothetical protein
MDHDDLHEAGPAEMAEHDEAAATRMRKDEEVDRSIQHGFEQLATTMSNLGYEESASNLLDSADTAHEKATAAKYSAAAYDEAAQSWHAAEHDLTEQAKLTGQRYAASATADGARQELAGAHALTDAERTSLQLTAAKEDAVVPVLERRAEDMGAEARQAIEHARVEEQSARLGDPESRLQSE